MSDDISTCARCTDTVRWCYHVKTGNRAPINVHKVLGGNVRISWDNVTNRWTYSIVKSDPEREEYTNHFATCPAAKSFRR